MPRIDFDSEIMESSTRFKDSSDKVISSEPALVFGYSHAFGTSYSMLDPYPEGGYLPVMFFLLWSKLSTLWFLQRLYNNHLLRLVPLVSGILVQYTGRRERIHRLGDLLIMCLSAKTWTDKQHKAAGSDDQGILKGMLLFLSAVIFLLFVRIDRTGYFSLCAVMQQNGRLSCLLRKVLEYPRKLPSALGWHYLRLLQALFKNQVQHMDKAITMLLIHPKTSRMVFLERVVLQINQNEEQALFHCGKWTVFINSKTPASIAEITIHVIDREILIMGFLKIRKQLPELIRGKDGQRTKTFGLVLMFDIFHPVQGTCAHEI